MRASDRKIDPLDFCARFARILEELEEIPAEPGDAVTAFFDDCLDRFHGFERELAEVLQ